MAFSLIPQAKARGRSGAFLSTTRLVLTERGVQFELFIQTKITTLTCNKQKIKDYIITEFKKKWSQENNFVIGITYYKNYNCDNVSYSASEMRRLHETYETNITQIIS